MSGVVHTLHRASVLVRASTTLAHLDLDVECLSGLCTSETEGERVMMAKRILVPLDRTQNSEAVLPLVYDLARGAGSTVRLLHVKPVPNNVVSDSGRVVAYADQEMTRLEAEGLTYMDALAAQLQDVPVERVVRFGNPAHEILLEAETFGADVIALTTAGRGRLRPTLSRSIAARISRKSTVPVLLLREPSRRRVPVSAESQSKVSSWAATSRS